MMLLTFLLVYWYNVGVPHKEQVIGRLLSVSATGLTCLFWSIPTTFVSTLSSVQALKDQYKWMADVSEAVPVFDQVLELVAPLTLLALNAGL